MTDENSLNPDFLAQVRKLAGLGLSKTQIYCYYGYVSDAWDELIKQYPEIMIAMRQGRAQYGERVTSKLFDQIEKNNLKAIMFYLEMRCGWRKDLFVDEFGEKDSKGGLPPITLTVNDPIEAAKIYQSIMTGS
jgi:hypothetical protein